MEAIADLAVAALAGGARRARRRPAGQRVVPTRWLLVAGAAVAVQMLTLCGLAAGVAWLAVAALRDELFVYLSVIVAPIFLGAVFLMLGGALFLAGSIRRLAVADGAARVDVAVAGCFGCLAAVGASSIGATVPALVFAVPAAVLMVLACAPDVWRPAAVPTSD
jgi:hypothetical protein